MPAATKAKPDSDILYAADFSFAPYLPNREGDSGALLLATAKVDSTVQYIVKSETAELACNEFLYHKIATLLGLHTQEVKLFRDAPSHRFAAGSRYSPNAIPYRLEGSDKANRHDFFCFEALYIILNEEDSEEFYIDEKQRVFKLDNAAAFCMDYFFADALLQRPGSEMSKKLQTSKLQYTCEQQYLMLLKTLSKKHGDEAADDAVDMFMSFAELDEAALHDAYATLDAIYPAQFSSYYRAFIAIRKAACQRFVHWLCEDGE